MLVDSVAVEDGATAGLGGDHIGCAQLREIWSTCCQPGRINRIDSNIDIAQPPREVTQLLIVALLLRMVRGRRGICKGRYLRDVRTCAVSHRLEIEAGDAHWQSRRNPDQVLSA